MKLMTYKGVYFCSEETQPLTWTHAHKGGVKWNTCNSFLEMKHADYNPKSS